MKKKDQMLTIPEACEIFNRCRQSILNAIKNKRLKAEKIDGKWMFYLSEWNKYYESRYDRIFSEKDGEKIYQPENGFLSPSMICETMNLDKKRIYYLMRIGVIPYTRVKSAYVIDVKHIAINYNKIFYEKYKRQKSL